MPGASAEKPPLERVGVSSVGVTGFEPATSSSRTTRATKLRHTPMVLWTSTSITPSAGPVWTARLRPCVGRACRDPARSAWSRPARRSRGFDKLNQRVVPTHTSVELVETPRGASGGDPASGGFDKLNQRGGGDPALVELVETPRGARGRDRCVGREVSTSSTSEWWRPIRRSSLSRPREGTVSRPEPPGPPLAWVGCPQVPPCRPRRRPCRPGWPGYRTRGSSP
jgi:hypothetical protein